jgi:uncharacterized membrane protein
MPRQPSTTVPPAEKSGVRFSIRNWTVLALGVVIILGGYALLAGGSTIAAPVLLILGYVVVLPAGILV